MEGNYVGGEVYKGEAAGVWECGRRWCVGISKREEGGDKEGEEGRWSGREGGKEEGGKESLEGFAFY